MRPGEENGKSYHFVSRDQFEDLIKKGEFLEHAEFGGNLYGTSAQAVRDVSEKGEGRRAILDIDAQGVRLIKANHAHLNPVYVFISPPTYDTLRSRLEGRATDAPEAIQRRLRMALHELEYARQGKDAFDVVIVNDDLNRAYGLLRNVVHDKLDGPFDQVPPPDNAEDAYRQSASS